MHITLSTLHSVKLNDIANLGYVVQLLDGRRFRFAFEWIQDKSFFDFSVGAFRLVATV